MSDIKKLRESINQIDKQIIELLSQRRNIARKVAEYKIENNLPIKDEQREKNLITCLTKDSIDLDLNLPPKSILTIFSAIIEDSCEYQAHLFEALQGVDDSTVITKPNKHKNFFEDEE